MLELARNEILQSTGDNIQLSRQRDGTIADEILAFLNKKPTAETSELRQATQSSPQGFSLAIKKLIAAGEVRKVKRVGMNASQPMTRVNHS